MQQTTYEKIARWIEYAGRNGDHLPRVGQIAEWMEMPSNELDGLIREWSGTTADRFLPYTTAQHARALLQNTIAAPEADQFVLPYLLHEMNRPEQRNLQIHYSFADSPFGNVIVASSSKGICYLAFENDEAKAVEDLQIRFPHATLRFRFDAFQQQALSILRNDPVEAPVIFHLKGTHFQLDVWQALLSIPMGRLMTYGEIAARIGKPAASRAVGTAIGSNPVAFLIPCHRVVRASGNLGGYMWGETRKKALIGWESARSGMEAGPDPA